MTACICKSNLYTVNANIFADFNFRGFGRFSYFRDFNFRGFDSQIFFNKYLEISIVANKTYHDFVICKTHLKAYWICIILMGYIVQYSTFSYCTVLNGGCTNCHFETELIWPQEGSYSYVWSLDQLIQSYW